MKVLLYKVNRNLNRCYRTCEAFGISEIELLECKSFISGNLFKSKDKVNLVEVKHWPNNNALYLETYYEDVIYDVNWNTVSTIVLGGETSGIPKKYKGCQNVKIPMVGVISGLTVEAALAIVLYEWQKFLSKNR